MDVDDPTTDSPIRPNALHLSGSPLAHLSTAKVVSYAGLFGPLPDAVEWINDHRLVLRYSDADTALEAINLLAKTGFQPYADSAQPKELLDSDDEGEPEQPRDLLDSDHDRGTIQPRELIDRIDPTENAWASGSLGSGDDPLELRACHNVPMSLLPTFDIEGELVTGTDLLAESEIVDGLMKATKGDNAIDSSQIPEGLRPGARLDVRFAVESDVKAKTKPEDSQWYKRYGRDAGKAPENVMAPQEILAEEYELQTGGGRRRRGGGGGRRDGEGDRRGGGRRRSRSPSNILGYGRRHRDGEGLDEDRYSGEAEGSRHDRGGHGRRDETNGRRDRASAVDLDKDLADMRRDAKGGGGGRDRGGGKKSQADLDRELDDFFSSRRDDAA